ncbi:uncharacterized protein FOMMEDRAFT_164915 [Fomitiporia mediterranea MF3/22]|uniref:uncharacterized protein n=1 Tax=Fomitiporia mediterranea (strain MF3/22) TaxID=694068 RepID=UPI00044082B1|nr:uncharacterized protein FOMMEDRAFT_164915 [Fomitiporia mediterranea MF3/22]EJD08227.1 hypothetical protein FOMMEDRAFT_164915 [Fomitiporia mediterranea MF3/22]
MTTSSSTFRLGKDSQAIYPDFAPGFKGFFGVYSGAKKEYALPDYTGSTASLSRVEQLIRESIEGAKKEGAKKDEVPMYGPLAKALTLISLDVCQDDKVIAFVPNHNVHLKVTDGSRDKPDLVGFFVKCENAERLVNEANYKIEVPSAHEIKVAVECKVEENPLLQGERYCFALARHRHGSSLQYSLIINTNRFQLISLNLDGYGIWDPVNWKKNDQTPILKLYESIKLIWIEASKARDKRVPVPEFLITLDNGKSRSIALYTTCLDGKLFYLIPIFIGRGNGRKPFVALGFAADDFQLHRAVKWSWHLDDNHSRERYFLGKLKDAPGVVRIDEQLSSDSVQHDAESGRNQNVVVQETIGRSVSSCRSVLEFLETMYDLLEVLRYHVCEAHVLHRDISWGNVLIPEKDTPQIPKKEANWDKYQFISDYYGSEDDIPRDNTLQNTKPRRVRVALADFDNARDLTSETDDLKHATGTPMFMARDVLEPRSKRHMRSFVEDDVDMIQVAAASSVKQYHNGEEAKWEGFYRDLGHIRYVNRKNPEETFRHGAMHDAESVYYLCLLFFSRMVREGEEISDDDLYKKQIDRGEVFGQLARKKAGRGNSDPFPHELPSSGFEADFFDMLHVFYYYLKTPWYNVLYTGHGEPFEFHLHDFMQRLFLKEIYKLRISSSIPLELYPLAVKSNVAVHGDSYSFQYSSSGMKTYTKIMQPANNKGPTDRSAKRIKLDKAPDFMKTTNLDSMCNWSSFDKDRAQELTKSIPEVLLMVLWHKRKEKLWLTSDKDE